MASEWQVASETPAPADPSEAPPKSAGAGEWQVASETKVERPRFDFFGDWGRAAREGATALIGDLRTAFPSMEQRHAQLAESQTTHAGDTLPGGALLEDLGRDIVQTPKQMGAAARSVLDALGIVSSPVTGAAHATLGSALSFLPGVNKEQADEGVDQALMGMRPSRVTTARPPVLPPDFNVLRDTAPPAPPQPFRPPGPETLRNLGPKGMARYGFPTIDAPIIPNHDFTRNTGRPPLQQASRSERDPIPPGVNVAADTESPLAPRVSRQAAQARDFGYVFPPAMMLDEPGAATAAGAGQGGKIKLRQDASVKNQDVTNRKAPTALGLAEGTPLTDARYEAVRREAGAAYERLAQKVPNTAHDRDFLLDIRSIGGQNSEATRLFPRIMGHPEIQELIAEQLDPRNANVSTATRMETIKELRRQSRNDLRVPANAQSHALGLAKREISDAIENLIDRNVGYEETRQRYDPRIARYLNEPDPDLRHVAQDYRDARQRIAMSHALQDATNPATQDVRASWLARLLDKGEVLTGPLRTIAESFLSFPRGMQDVASFGGSEAHSALDYFATAGMAAHGHPLIAGTVAARPAMRKLLLTDAYQNWLTRPRNTALPGKAAVATAGASEGRGAKPDLPSIIRQLTGQ